METQKSSSPRNTCFLSLSLRSAAKKHAFTTLIELKTSWPRFRNSGYEQGMGNYWEGRGHCVRILQYYFYAHWVSSFWQTSRYWGALLLNCFGVLDCSVLVHAHFTCMNGIHLGTTPCTFAWCGAHLSSTLRSFLRSTCMVCMNYSKLTISRSWLTFNSD